MRERENCPPRPALATLLGLLAGANFGLFWLRAGLSVTVRVLTAVLTGRNEFLRSALALDSCVCCCCATTAKLKLALVRTCVLGSQFLRSVQPEIHEESAVRSRRSMRRRKSGAAVIFLPILARFGYSLG